MQRGHIIAVILVAVALALVGVRLFIGGSTPPSQDDVVADAAGAQPRSGSGAPSREGESRERERSRRSALVDQLPVQRQAPRDEIADDERAEGGAGGSAEVIGGSQGGSAPSGSSGSNGAQGADGSAASAKGVAAPAGAAHGAASAGGGQGAAPHRPVESAETAAGGAPHDPAAAPVLLSLPLKGNVDADQGDSPTKADGVVVDGDTVEFTDDAQVTMPSGGHVNGQAGSIAFDIEPRWDGSEESNHSLLQIRDADTWANNLQIVKNLDSLRFVIVDSAGIQTDVSVDIGDWQADQSHRITATWGQAAMTLYIDGQPVGQAVLANGPTFRSTTPIHIGSDFPGSQYRSADGRISNLTIYGRPLNANEVH